MSNPKRLQVTSEREREREREREKERERETHTQRERERQRERDIPSEAPPAAPLATPLATPSLVSQGGRMCVRVRGPFPFLPNPQLSPYILYPNSKTLKSYTRRPEARTRTQNVRQTEHRHARQTEHRHARRHTHRRTDTPTHAHTDTPYSEPQTHHNPRPWILQTKPNP